MCAAHPATNTQPAKPQPSPAALVNIYSRSCNSRAQCLRFTGGCVTLPRSLPRYQVAPLLLALSICAACPPVRWRCACSIQGPRQRIAPSAHVLLRTKQEVCISGSLANTRIFSFDLGSCTTLVHNNTKILCVKRHPLDRQAAANLRRSCP